jgi:CheY-like chemotaxis protein
MPRILVAEDSRTQAAIIQHMLEEAGYQVTLAGHGREALDLLRLTRMFMDEARHNSSGNEITLVKRSPR